MADSIAEFRMKKQLGDLSYEGTNCDEGSGVQVFNFEPQPTNQTVDFLQASI